MIRAARERRIDTVFVLIIFSIFAMSVLIVLALGATVYQNMTEISRDGHDEHTVLSYIWTKVKNSDEAENISVGDFHGRSALFIDEEFDGIRYRTHIYHHDGWLYELFCEAELEFFPEDGVRIVRIDELIFSGIDSGLIQVSAGARTLLLTPRGGLGNVMDLEG